MERAFKALIALFIYITASDSLFAQIKIEGRVLETGKDIPLQYAEVFVSEFNKGAVTDKNGHFVIKNLKKGNITLVVTHVGYEPAILKLECNNDTTLTVKLSQSILKIPEVVVSAGVSTQHENAITIDVIHASQVFDNTEGNVVMALRNVQGVDVVSRGNGISQPVIRGMTGNNISVLINGIKLENYQFSVNHPFMVDAPGLKKIEVIKGPASLLYGSGAMGGAVNFITHDVVYNDTVSGSLYSKFFSNGAGMVSGGELNWSKNKLFVNLAGEIKNVSDYFDATGRRVYNTAFAGKTLMISGGRIGERNRTSFLFRYLKPEFGLYVPQLDTNNRKNLMKPVEWYQDLTDKLFIFSDNVSLGNSELEIKLSQQINNRKLHTSKDMPVFTPIDMTLNTSTGKIIFTHNFNKIFELKTGIEAVYQENKNNDAPEHLIPDANIYNMAGFAVGKWYAGEKLIFQFGMRYDFKNILTLPDSNEIRINNFYNNYTWSGGLTYKLFDKVLLRINMASGFRTPSLPELTQNGVHGDRYEKGDITLKPQTNYEGDLGIHFHAEKFYADVSAFVNSLRNYIYLSPSNDTLSGLPVYYYVQDDAVLYGVELSVMSLVCNNFKLGADFSYLRGMKSDGNDLPFIQQPELKGKAAYKNKIRLGSHDYEYELSFMPVYGMEDKHHASGEMPGMEFFKSDVALFFKTGFERVRLSAGINVKNVFNNLYYDKLSMLSNYGFYAPGRSLNLMLRLNF